MTLRVPSVRGILAFIGVLAVAFSVGVLEAPATTVARIEALVTTVTRGVDPKFLVMVLGGLVLFAGLLKFISGRTASPEAIELADEDVETAATEADLAGVDFDRVVTTARAEFQRDQYSTTSESARERLRETAADTLATFTDRDADAAVGAVNDGTWTDDRITAAFLSDETGPSMPISRRIYAWLYPDRAFERRVLRAVTAIAEIAAQPTPDATAIEHSLAERSTVDRRRR